MKQRRGIARAWLGRWSFPGSVGGGQAGLGGARGLRALTLPAKALGPSLSREGAGEGVSVRVVGRAKGMGSGACGPSGSRAEPWPFLPHGALRSWPRISPPGWAPVWTFT